MNKKRFLASFLSAAMLCSPLQGSNAYSAKSDSNQGVNTAAKVAMGVGIGVAGLAVLLGVPLLCWGLSKDNSENKNQEDNSVSDNGGAVTDNSGNTTVNSDPKGTPKTNVSPVTPRKPVEPVVPLKEAKGTSRTNVPPVIPHKPVEPVVPQKKVPVGKPIGDAQADYKRKNPTRDTFFEGYKLYNSRKPNEGTRVGQFLSYHCRVDKLDSSTKASKDIRRGFLVKRISGQGWVPSQDLGDDLPDRIFIQVGNEEEENISYSQLHSLLWSEKSGNGGLTQFLHEHHDYIKDEFLKELINNGYDNAVNNAFPGRFQIQSDRSSEPQVKPVDVSTGTQSGSTGTGVVPGTHVPVAGVNPKTARCKADDPKLKGQVKVMRKRDEITATGRMMNEVCDDSGARLYMTDKNGEATRHATGSDDDVDPRCITADKNNEKILSYISLSGTEEQKKLSCEVIHEELPATPRRATGASEPALYFCGYDTINTAKLLRSRIENAGKPNPRILILNAASEITPGGAPARKPPIDRKKGVRKQYPMPDGQILPGNADEEGKDKSSGLYLWLTGGDNDNYYIEGKDWDYNPNKCSVAHDVPVYSAKRERQDMTSNRELTDLEIGNLETFDFLNSAARNLSYKSGGKECGPQKRAKRIWEQYPNEFMGSAPGSEEYNRKCEEIEKREVQETANQTIKVAAKSYDGLVLLHRAGGVFKGNEAYWIEAWANAISEYGSNLNIAFAILAPDIEKSGLANKYITKFKEKGINNIKFITTFNTSDQAQDINA